MALDQANLDGGSFDLAWLLTLEEEPPFQVFSRAPPPATAMGRAFTPLASQQWATVAMAYLKELDTLQTRRAEVVRHRQPPRPQQGHETPEGEAAGAGGRRRPKGKGDPPQEAK